MLRVLVLLLLLANMTYLVWVQGMLAPYGFAPASQAEPERLEQQIRPEAIELLGAQPAASSPLSAAAPASAASAASAPALIPSAPASVPSVPASAPPAPSSAVTVPSMVASAPEASSAAIVPVALKMPEPEPEAPQCLQAGLFTELQTAAMRPRLQANLPAGSWSFANAGKPARWIVYMGKYASKESMNKRRALLEQAGLPSEIALSPLLTPGLTLGSFKTKAQAEAALEKVTERGIRSARVTLERPELPTQWLRLPAASPAVQAKAKTLVPKVSGKRLQPCS